MYVHEQRPKESRKPGHWAGGEVSAPLECFYNDVLTLGKIHTKFTKDENEQIHDEMTYRTVLSSTFLNDYIKCSITLEIWPFLK